jgi:hypothetical protein
MSSLKLHNRDPLYKRETNARFLQYSTKPRPASTVQVDPLPSYLSKVSGFSKHIE